jgi:selenocysteine-specific elongation factor
VEIQPIVIGTAGHIDHGKSTLVRALTGVDPDRLKEEKERGLTIDLGFAPLQLADGRTVGIVDVPGHERFIKNMVAGATGIDLVVLVVAADDGVMPQTREHLSIMSLLGVERGLIALTKVDAVDEEMAELAAEDVREAVAGTFLEDAPLFPVSGVTGQGLEELRATLFEMAAAVEPRSAGGVFRMPIQRVFSARGFGTIVTGIPVSGSVGLGDTLEILPGGQKGKVRGIQAYKQEATRARAGHSTALNLSDVAHKEVHRGCVAAAPGYYRAVRMVGARLTVLKELVRPLQNRTPIRLHTGTAEAVGEVVLLDAPELEPGATGLVQFRLEEPLVCAAGDRFILRLASPLLTLGGGSILEESRYRLKRFKGFVLDELQRQEASLDSPEDLTEVVLMRAGERLSTPRELAVAVKRAAEDVRGYLAGLAARGAAVSRDGGNRWIHAEALERGLGRLREALEGWFGEHPLRSVIDLRDLRAAVRTEPGVLELLLEEEAARGGLSLEPGGKVRPAGARPALEPELLELRGRVEARLVAAGLQPPGSEELAEQLDCGREQLTQLLESLADEGQVAHGGKGLSLAREPLERAREEVIANCRRHGELAIPELRDALGTTRKFLIPLLEHFDAVGVTLRQGGRRVLKSR